VIPLVAEIAGRLHDFTKDMKPLPEPVSHSQPLWLFNIGTTLDVYQQFSEPMMCLSLGAFDIFKMPAALACHRVAANIDGNFPGPFCTLPNMSFHFCLLSLVFQAVPILLPSRGAQFTPGIKYHRSQPNWIHHFTEFLTRFFQFLNFTA
jgi:hypothetical protein